MQQPVEFDTISLRRGGQGYVLHDHIFIKKSKTPNKIYLRCQNYKDGCKAAASISIGNNRAKITENNHNHEPPYVEAFEFRAKLIEESVKSSNSRLTLESIYTKARNDVLASTSNRTERDETINKLPKFSTMQSTMSLARSKVLLKAPTSRANINATKEKGGTKINGTTDKADTKPKSPSSTSEGSPSATPTDEPDADKKDGVVTDAEDAKTPEDSKENLQNGTTEPDEKPSTGDTAEDAAATLDSETKPKVSGDDDAADVKKEEDTDKEDTKPEKTADSADGDAGSGSEDATKTNGEVNKDVPAKYDTNAAIQSGPTVGLLGMEALGDDERHRLRHRELFLSRQIETLPATHIRGKCSVTLLNEMETPNSYLGRDDSFFYSLVYDPQQRTLLADKGEIRIGDKFQAVIPDFLATPAERKAWREGEILETVVFRPSYHVLTERQIDQFLIVARSVGTFARALDSSSAAKQPSLHMSAAAASRDVSLFHALSLLHHADYDIGKAMCFLVPPPDKNLYPLCADKTTGHRTSALGGPLLCRDQLEEWSAAEAVLFEEALEKYGKDFNDIRQDFLPWKALRDIVEYYYMWKTTDRYIHQKRFKAVEAESRLKQVYIPTYNKPNPAAMSPSNPPGQLIACGKACEGCELEKSTQWYMWGPLQFHFRLCQECWSYWKKFGGLRKPHKMDTYDKMGRGANNADSIEQGSDQDQLRCSECKKQFETPEKLSTHRATAHPPMRCPMDACRREFRSRNLLQRHLAVEHGIGTVPPAPGQPGSNDLGSPLTPENQLMVSGRNGPKVPRQPFFLHTTFLTRVARRLAPKRLLSARRHARNPFLNINVQLIKNNCQTKSPVEIMRIAQSIANRSQNLSLQREQQQNQVQQQMINSAENAKLANAAEAKKRQQNGVADGAPPMKMMKSGTEESAY